MYDQFLSSVTKMIEGQTSRNIIIDFWKDFYNKNFHEIQEEKTWEKSNRNKYKDRVVERLNDFKMTHEKPYYPEDLRSLQKDIERLTVCFDEESIHATCSHIMQRLIHPKKINAKDFVLERLTSDIDKEIVSNMGQYTLEAIIVYVVSLLYSSEASMIRVSTLIDQLDRQVKHHVIMAMSKKEKIAVSMKELGQLISLGENYPIGVALVDFIINREMMTIQLMDDKLSSVPIQKKKGKYYLPKLLYAIYNYDISLLPLKLNLPMICKPEEWQSARYDFENPRDMGDLRGGYLSGLGESARYKLLSSGNINNFFITLDDYEQLCDIMNTLQEVPFRINKPMLDFVNKDYQSFVNEGLLMPKTLCNANMKMLGESLRNAYMNHEGIRCIYNFSDVLNILHKDVQRALLEQRVLNIAEALEGFELYFPVFLDFRGRIYRSGLMHFHERDLIRSLILFSRSDDSVVEGLHKRHQEATAFYYKSFDNYSLAKQWYENESQRWSNMSFEELFSTMARAKKPFQFIASRLFEGQGIAYDNCLPITQDASSSAYQIMSFLLLDQTMAVHTNLVSLEGYDHIFDIYTDMQKKLIDYVISLPDYFSVKGKMVLSPDLKLVVRDHFDRKLVKSIFMPLIYGKTMNSTANDLRDALPKWLTKQDSFTLAEICFRFWRENYNNMDCLINLIKNIGWIVSFKGDHVRYSNNLFSTIQKYTKKEAVKLWIFDKVNKKRRQVTLRVSTDKNDRRKSEISTFVNFIHQLDAFFSMKVIVIARKNGIPIYTVHDNFITTANYSDRLADIYREVIMDESPLSIINRYIYQNLIEPIGILRELSQAELDFLKILYSRNGSIDEIIPINMLLKYLKKNKPADLKKKRDIETWEKRVDAILTSYKLYIRYICKISDQKDPYDLNTIEYYTCMHGYDKNYRKFHSLMSKSNVNYSLHY